MNAQATPRIITDNNATERLAMKYFLNHQNHRKQVKHGQLFKNNQQASNNNSQKQKRFVQKQDQWIKNTQEKSKLPYMGFDNSDKNKLRQSIGSCTDMVAEERRSYGPWQALDADCQQRLVNRLAPHKLPPLPDPRFDTWINHFQHYWNIGKDVKPPAKSAQLSVASQARFPSESSPKGCVPEDNHKSLYVTCYHRTLRRQPAASERLGKTDPGWISGRRERTRERTSGNERTSYNKVVSGFDRRYMGLQTVQKSGVVDILQRVTRITSAYQAKFSPNPHVWVDLSPGAHMVVKKENTFT